MNDNLANAQLQYDRQEPEAVPESDPMLRLPSAGRNASLYLDASGDRFLFSLYNDMGNCAVFISADDLEAIVERGRELLKELAYERFDSQR